MTPRDYQAQDLAQVLDLHKQHQSLIGWAATGLGKAVLLGMLAEHYAKSGRVMVLVDVAKLVYQLADTIERVTGEHPAIEMAEQRAEGSMLGASDRIVVSTVQSQYSGEEGRERYRRFNPDEFSAILLDECELFLAPKARSVVEWYRNNPAVRIFGCTATPFRTDGVAMANLFNAVAFERNILWGIDNGWLVRARQAFVHVSVDFSTLKVDKNSAGEADYSDADIAERIGNEQTLIELAKGILHVAGDRKSIVVCPTVATAQAVAHYLEMEKAGAARCIYGELGDTEKSEIFDSHKAGEFQFLTSVMMLSKGYDDASIRAVFNCRKTRSKRLYTQVLGRGVRPWAGIVDGCNCPEERKLRIAGSPKPDALMVNMVGIGDDVRDMTVLDVLGTPDDAINLRAKQIMADDEEIDPAEAIEQAAHEVELEREVEAIRVDEAQRSLDEADEARMLRRSVRVDAEIGVEWSDDLRVGNSAGAMDLSALPDRASSKQVNYLVYLGVHRETAKGYSRRQASAVISSLKAKVAV
jgi:superfamily II DNA or RNA helicase